MKRTRTAGLGSSIRVQMQTKYKACVNIYIYVHKCIWICTKCDSSGCAPRTGAGRWGQQGCQYLHTLPCSCPVCGTEEQAGAKAPVQKPVQSRCISSTTSASPGCLWWWCLELYEGCRITFSARFLRPHPQYNGGFRKSSKPVAKAAVLSSPYEGGMPRTCTNMNLLPIYCSWSGTVFSFSPEATWCYSPDHWSWTYTVYVLVVHFWFVNCIAALPPCLHTKYMQYCSDLWAGHLRGMILPYDMHWDCVPILLEGETLSDTNFE